MSAINHQLTLTREQWRWWFAGQAMAGYMSNPTSFPQDKDVESPQVMAEIVGVFSRMCANALIAELERTAP